MPVNLNCPCGCKIEFNEASDGKLCSCEMYKLQIQTIDNRKVSTIVSV